jgi:hypothetical protein
MNNELQVFVKESLVKGLTQAQMKTALAKAGWQADEIKNALNLYADMDFPVAVPRRHPYLSAREAFEYLVLFFTLYISAFSLGTILFQFVNRWLPDAAESYDYALIASTSTIRSSTAALVITFPVFLFMTSILQQAITRDPDKRSSKVRKWLTYITLFLASGIIIGDLITLVTYLLGGELTLRFILKVIIVLAIAGSIFGFYLWNLRGEEKES